VTAHALVSAAWLLLFLVQAVLAAMGYIDAHRRVGWAGAVLTVVFVVLGFFTVIEQARRGFDLSGDIGRLAPPGTPADPVDTVGILFFFLTFAVLAGAALCYRHRPSVHKRLMLFALLAGLTPTPITHLLGHWPALRAWAGAIVPLALIFVLFASAIYDRV